MQQRLAVILIVLLLGATAVAPTQAQEEEPVVRAVMFWMEGCGHCVWVKENVLPPLAAQYGEQWQLELVELRTAEDFERLFDLGAAIGVPRENIGVPFLLIGDAALIGSGQIPAELSGLIKQYLAAGGVGLPTYPALADLLPEGAAQPGSPAVSVSGVPPTGAVVQTILFSTPDCHDCQLIIAQAITPLREQYGDALQVQKVNIVTSEDVDYLYQVGASFDLSPEQVSLPMLVVGERVLIGEQIPAALSELVEQHLNAGGVSAPVLPSQSDAASLPAEPVHSGFTLAVIILAGMVLALAYTAGRIWQARQGQANARPPAWIQSALPLLAVVGLGVAAYLAYVETQAVTAVCGPVGDCNAVQTSEYAYLLGIPIGVLGVLGYVAILAAWAWGKWQGDKRAPLVLLAMTAFGVLFSIYLTYLEPFVIGAVCAWCLTSAVVMTALMVLSVETAVPQLQPIPVRRARRR